jgi:hypothetical protein
VTEPLVPHHLLEHLTEREQHARAEIDRFRAAIADLTVQMEAAGHLADRLRLTRQTLQEITEQAEPEQQPATPASDTSSTPAPLPPAYQDILAVLTRTDTGLRAKDLCHALHLDDQSRHVETMRAKLKRLVGRDLLTEPEPGLFIIKRPKP